MLPLTSVEEQNADSARAGDWTQTWTGRRFWPLEPKPGDFHLADIARGLSNECRFGGQIDFYSVAQHCLLVLHFVDLDTAGWAGLGREDALKWAILHDAAEAYMKDIPRPHKRWWGGYAAAETFVLQQLALRFGVPEYGGESWPFPEIVKKADNDALMTESLLLYPRKRIEGWRMPGTDRRADVPEFFYDKEGYFIRYKPEDARELYIERFKALFGMGQEDW